MSKTEEVIKDLNTAKFILCLPTIDLTRDLRFRIGEAINEAIDLLQKRERKTGETEVRWFICKKCGRWHKAYPATIMHCPFCGAELDTVYNVLPLLKMQETERVDDMLGKNKRSGKDGR